MLKTADELKTARGSDPEKRKLDGLYAQSADVIVSAPENW